MASESMPSAWIRSSSSGIRLAPSRREYSLCVWRWTNAIRLAEDIGARVHCQNRAAPDILRPTLVALARLVGGAIAFPLLVVATVLLSVSPWFPLTAPQSPGDAVAVALALGALSAVSSPAVAMGMLSELGARGPFARTLLA